MRKRILSLNNHSRLQLFIMLAAVLFLVAQSGCKALDDGNNGNKIINIVGKWLFTNVLQTNTADVHTRTFDLAGTKDAGTVTEDVSSTTGTYTVTNETTFKMELENWDPGHRWEYVYEGTIIDNNNMSGVSKTTTYDKTTGAVIFEGTYNYTAARQK